MKKEIELTLSVPLKYSKGGEYEEESVLLMVAPNIGSSKTRKNARRLKNLALVALQKANSLNREEAKEEVKEEDDSEVSGADFMTLLGMGGSDTNEIIDAMKYLAPSVITIGETGIALKNELWEKLSMEDEEEITGRYLHDFLLPFGASEKKN
jgi:hypothetical protein